MKSEFPGAVPEIPVSHIDKAAAYYETKLGFTLDWGGEELGLAGISKDNCRIFLANPAYRKQYGNVGPVLTWLNLDSRKAVDELYDVWSSREAKLVSKPESKPWGLHEFMAEDLDGNLFRVFYDFATPARGDDALTRRPVKPTQTAAHRPITRLRTRASSPRGRTPARTPGGSSR